jgi:hypothetical protein
MAGGKGGGGSNTAYEAPNVMGFNPTRSRELGDLVLLTCGSETGPQRASGGGGAQPVFNDGGISF